MGIFAHILAGGAEGGFGSWKEGIDQRIEDERATGLLAKKEESLRNLAEHKEGLRRESEEIKSGREIVGYTEEGMPITRGQLGDLGEGETLGVYGSALGREVDKSSFSKKYVDSQGNVWAYDPKDPSNKYLLGPGKGSGGSGGAGDGSGGGAGGGGAVSAAHINAVRQMQEALIKQYKSWEKAAENIKPFELDAWNAARTQLGLPPLSVETVRKSPGLLQSILGLTPGEEKALMPAETGAGTPATRQPAPGTGGESRHLASIFNQVLGGGGEPPAQQPGPRRATAEAAAPPSTGLLETQPAPQGSPQQPKRPPEKEAPPPPPVQAAPPERETARSTPQGASSLGADPTREGLLATERQAEQQRVEAMEARKAAGEARLSKAAIEQRSAMDEKQQELQRRKEQAASDKETAERTRRAAKLAARIAMRYGWVSGN